MRYSIEVCMYKQLIEYAVKRLVDAPELVEIVSHSSDAKDSFEIKVGTQDIGKVIGKEGQTIRALRMLLGAVTPEGREIEITVAK